MHSATAHTILASATAPGRAGVAVIRISGPQAAQALAALGTPLPAPRQASLTTWRHPHTHEPLDQGLTLWFPAPRSFTGEDVIELHTHGSAAVTKAMLAALLSIPGLR